jgi:hypothetical protein
MILKVHVQGVASYDIGDEIWQEPLADAINAEAEMIAGMRAPTCSSPHARRIATPSAIGSLRR